jgi:hypothetical protein
MSAVLTVALIVQISAATGLLGHAFARPAPATAVQSAPTAVAHHTVRLVGAGADTAPLLMRLEAEMAAAVDAVVAFWGGQWQREIVVVATASDDEFAAQAGDPNRDWPGVAAVAVADRLDLDHHVASGQRIVFAPGAMAMGDAALRIVLRHELFHYAARAETAVDAPRWLTEGVADYVARPPAPPPGPNVVRADLPTDDAFDAVGPRRSAAYDQAWWFARFVADEYGQSALRRLYVRACGPGHVPLPAAVVDTLDIELADLLVAWQHWLAAG